MRAAGWRPDIEPPRDILVIKPSSLGDVVHTLPAVAQLRQAFPASRIRWLVNTEWRPLLAENPYIDEAIEFPRRTFRGLAGVNRLVPWARALRDRIDPDLILDYQGLLRSALIAKLCRGKNTRVLGLGDAREGSRFFYDEAVPVTGIQHAVERYLALTHRITGAPASTTPLSWTLPAGEMPAGFPENEPCIVLHPFSRGQGKSMTPADVTELCQRLAPHRVVLVGQSTESVTLPDNTVNLLNQTSLTDLCWVLRRAAIVISVDSGPMHMAAALSPKLISIHTWSDPAKVGPYRPDAWVWQQGRLSTQADRENPAAHREVANIPALAEFVSSQL